METSVPPQVLQLIATAIERTRQVNYCNVSSVTILALDWLLTLELEVSLVWPSRWNLTKVLYFLARYSPFIDTSFVLYHQFGFALPVDICKMTYEYAAWMFIIGMACAELILTLRTWAVWEKDKRLTYGLPIFFLTTWGAGFAIMAYYLRSTRHEASPLPQLFGCIVRDTNTILSACYILLMVYDAGILLLMIIRGVSALRSGRDSHLLRVVYSDGIIYYIYLFGMGLELWREGLLIIALGMIGLSLINTIVILKLPGDYVNLLVMVERVVHSVLACRVILHIREQGQIQQQGRQQDLFGESLVSVGRATMEGHDLVIIRR